VLKRIEGNDLRFKPMFTVLMVTIPLAYPGGTPIQGGHDVSHAGVEVSISAMYTNVSPEN
jgi:hypothetical protein